MIHTNIVSIVKKT